MLCFGKQPGFIAGPPSGLRASISHKLVKAKSSAGKGLRSVGRAGRQLSNLPSRNDTDDASTNTGGVSAYAGLGPTGTAQDVSLSRFPCPPHLDLAVYKHTGTSGIPRLRLYRIRTSTFKNLSDAWSSAASYQ